MHMHMYMLIHMYMSLPLNTDCPWFLSFAAAVSQLSPRSARHCRLEGSGDIHDVCTCNISVIYALQYYFS